MCNSQVPAWICYLVFLCKEASKENTQQLKGWKRTSHLKPRNPFPKSGQKKAVKIFSLAFTCQFGISLGTSGWRRQKTQLCIPLDQQCHPNMQLTGLWPHSSSSSHGCLEDRYMASTTCLGCCLLGIYPTSGPQAVTVPDWAKMGPEDMGRVRKDTEWEILKTYVFFLLDTGH